MLGFGPSQFAITRPGSNMNLSIGIFLVVTLVRGTVSEFSPFLNDLYPSSVDRLPDDTVPESYALTVEPSFENQNYLFTGWVNITIRVLTTTSEIILNAKDLDVPAVEVEDVISHRRVELESWDYVENREIIKIIVKGFILANRRYIVRIRFSGFLRNDGTGFFKTFYTSNSGEKK